MTPAASVGPSVGSQEGKEDGELLEVGDNTASAVVGAAVVGAGVCGIRVMGISVTSTGAVVGSPVVG